MKFTKVILPNKIRLITIPMPSMESVTVQALVGAGSRDEKKHANGIAHFLEHMVFKGTKKYPTAQDVASSMDAVGAEGNAYTDKDVTAFHIKASEGHIDLCFDLVSELVKNPILRKDDIERERGVILEELAMYEDIPMRRAPEIFENLLYDGISLGWDIGGKRENILGIKHKDFVDYRDRYYYPENIVLAVAGRFEEKKVKSLVERYFGDALLRTRLWKGVAEKPASEKMQTNPGKKPQMRLVTKKTEQAHLVLGVRGNPRGGKDRYVESVLASILGGGMSSRLFTEIREKRGLAYYVRSSVDHYKDNGYFDTSSGVRVNSAAGAVSVILGEYAKIRDEGVGERELAKAKEYIKGKFALSLEDTGNVADFFGRLELQDKLVGVAEIMAGIDKVNSKDVKRVAKEFFVPERLNLAIVGPYKDAGKFEKLLKL